jgi:hypothetical protein
MDVAVASPPYLVDGVGPYPGELGMLPWSTASPKWNASPKESVIQ